MNKNEILFTCAGRPLEDLTEEQQAALSADPEMLKVFTEQARVASLMQLKNYELQDPAMEGRVIHRVGTRIRNGEHLQAAYFTDMVPGWARVVAVVVVMLGLSVLTHREMLQNPELPNELQAAVHEEEPLPFTPQAELKFQGPFSPVMVTFDNELEPNLLTPEFAQELENNFLELGLNPTNRTDNLITFPVSYSPQP